jgi:hypothetical protein
MTLSAFLRRLRSGSGYAMGAENDICAFRDLLQFVDKNRSASAQIPEDAGVVHDFVQHINRWPVDFEGCFYDFNGANDPGTETSRLC